MRIINLEKFLDSQNVVILVILRFLNCWFENICIVLFNFWEKMCLPNVVMLGMLLLQKKNVIWEFLSVPLECSNVSNVSNVVSSGWRIQNLYPKNVVILVILGFLKMLLEEKYFLNMYCTVQPECSNVSNVRNVASKRKIFFPGKLNCCS